MAQKTVGCPIVPPATLKVAAVTGSKGAGAGEGLTQDIRRERERTRPRTCDRNDVIL